MELIAIVIVIAVILTAEYLIFSKYALKSIYYSVEINKSEVYEGEYLELIETVENRRLIPLPWIKTELCASKWLAFLKKNSPVQTLGDENTFIPGVFSLKPHSRCIRTRKIKCLKRGIFSFDNTIITATDMLGLAKVSYSIPLSITVTVLPTASDNEDALLSFTEPIGEIPVKRFINDDPFMIAGSDEYTGREPLNRINWNYTAALNKLTVYNNEYSTSRSVLILMNMQRKDIYPVTCTDYKDVEAFIKLTVKICEECLDNGCPCAFVTNGGDNSQRGMASDLIISAEQYESVLRQLAGLDFLCSLDFGRLCESINTGGFTDIFIITPYIDDEMTEFAENMKSKQINTVFYCSGEIPEQENDDSGFNQFLHVAKFSYRFNY